MAGVFSVTVVVTFIISRTTHALRTPLANALSNVLTARPNDPPPHGAATRHPLSYPRTLPQRRIIHQQLTTYTLIFYQTCVVVSLYDYKAKQMKLSNDFVTRSSKKASKIKAMFWFLLNVSKTRHTLATLKQNSCSRRSIDVGGCPFIFDAVYSITVSVVQSECPR